MENVTIFDHPLIQHKTTILRQKSTSNKGNTLFRIRPNDVSHINLINIEIYKNGKAFVSIDASDRQPISFDGYIAANANAGQ